MVREINLDDFIDKFEAAAGRQNTGIRCSVQPFCATCFSAMIKNVLKVNELCAEFWVK